jgi:hypothetical protein
LDSADPAADHAELMHRTFAVLDHDVRTEEDELLPRLQQVLGPRRLRLLGWQWELVRRISPTRPHPVVSRRPPGQTLSALPLTVLDRTRDRLQQLDEVTRWRFTAAVAAADRLLAGAVERLPVLRRVSGRRPAGRSAARRARAIGRPVGSAQRPLGPVRQYVHAHEAALRAAGVADAPALVTLVRGFDSSVPGGMGLSREACRAATRHPSERSSCTGTSARAACTVCQ